VKVAIVGATSFIGQNLLFLLKKKNLKLIATFKSNKKIKKTRKITWKKLDIRKKKINYYKYLNNPDVVINLAWSDIPNYTTNKHLKTFNFQKQFNYNLIKHGLKNLIILGTCYEYGKINGKISENTICKPNTPYGKAKLKLLESITKAKSHYDFKFTWLRPFFVYGENRKRKTLYTLIREFDKGKKVKLKVCGKLVRDFLSVNFLCSVIFKILKLNKNIGILNVCSGKKITLKNFILSILKNKKKIKYIDMNGKNPNFFESNNFWGDNKKLNKIIN
tara:strand:- start:2427 stop:3254 length:828 start_codon:yes stop_codon:yes gene_type:complete